jgi:cytoskeletal protein CcmA (bactofilin family)
LPSRPSAVATPAAAPPRRPAEPIRQEPAREVRKLIVGREITLSGEIAACDHLIVEGTVEASVKECHRLEVSEAGLFRGAVEIHEAEIAGRFEGQITVQGRLSVRSTGRIEGKIQYGELAVDAGGTLDGEVRGHGKAVKNEKSKPVAEAPLLDQAGKEKEEEKA